MVMGAGGGYLWDDTNWEGAWESHLASEKSLSSLLHMGGYTSVLVCLKFTEILGSKDHKI